MPKIDSQITGTKQIPQSANQPMRDFTVPDESGFHQHPPIPPQQRRTTYETTQQPSQFDPEALRAFEREIMPKPPNPNVVRELNDVEQKIFEAKKAKREGKERMSEGAKRRLEMLIGMTRLTKTIDIGGSTFSLQALKNIETREALVAAAEYDGTVQFSFEYSKQLLARSLTMIAGVEFEQFIASQELEAKLDFVEELPQALFTRLYNEYVSLDAEARDKFAVKTEEQVKEVVADLKK